MRAFYRAMLCIARIMLSQDVRLFIRLSHSSILLKRLNISSDFFHRRVYYFRFSIPNDVAIFRRGPPLTGASNAKLYEKNHDFRPTTRFISDMVQDRAIVTMECKYETLPPAFKWYHFE